MHRLSIVVALLGFAVAVPHALAQDKQDKQGKRSLETSTSRPKENAPAQTGAQRVQDRTTSRTREQLDKNSVGRQQQTTRGAANKALKK